MKNNLTTKSINLCNQSHSTSLTHFRSTICIFLIVCMLIFNGFTFQTNIYDRLPSDVDHDSIADTINNYASKEVVYEISYQRNLKNLSDSGDVYTLYILKPYGYAIFLKNTNCMMEACLQPDAKIPIDESKSIDYYYSGPGHYYFKDSGTYRHVTSGYSLSSEMVDDLCDIEARALSSVISNLELQSSKSINAPDQNDICTTETPVQVSEYVGRSYFQNLRNFGNNTNGTCTIIAIAMLLGYYDYYINDSYVPTAYEQGDGTNDAFHLYLNNLVYGTQTPSGGIYIRNTTQAINNYLDSKGLTTEFNDEQHLVNYRNLANNIILYIKNDMPVIASMETIRGASWDHTVLIYGVTYNTDDPAGTAIYTAHTGWWPNSTAGTSYLLNASWFYECGYLECGLYRHGQGLIWNDVDANYHEITCHCGIYQKERHASHVDPLTGYCTKCGRKFNSVPEINSTMAELN